MTRAECIDERLAGDVVRFHGGPPIAWSRHAWTGLELFDTATPQCEPVTWLEGKRVVTMFGVGHPEAVQRQVESAGAVIAADIRVGDHERYDRARVTLAKSLCDGVDALLMTPKDWVKVRRLIDLASWPVPIVVPRLEIDVFEGAAALEDRLVKAVQCRS